ncbi:multidrug efflux SMR transporter [Thalassospira profundimaris]|nr:multidrug efflux SMR transporter [Thalassospira profundimaris]
MAVLVMLLQLLEIFKWNRSMVAWLYLFCAISLEVAGTVSLKFSDGFRDWRFTSLSLGLYAISFWVLSITLRQLPVSTAYAVWAGLGTAAIAIIGILFFREPVTLLKVVFLLMIISGVVGLNALGKH